MDVCMQPSPLASSVACGPAPPQAQPSSQPQGQPQQEGAISELPPEEPPLKRCRPISARLPAAVQGPQGPPSSPTTDASQARFQAERSAYGGSWQQDEARDGEPEDGAGGEYGAAAPLLEEAERLAPQPPVELQHQPHPQERAVYLVQRARAHVARSGGAGGGERNNGPHSDTAPCICLRTEPHSPAPCMRGEACGNGGGWQDALVYTATGRTLAPTRQRAACYGPAWLYVWRDAWDWPCVRG
jgi:hypothetical protein